MGKNTRTFPANTYFTYPHANGFLPDGQAIVIGCLEEGRCTLQRVDLETNQFTTLLEGIRPQPYLACVWYTIARQSGLLVTIFDNTAWLLDPHEPGSIRQLYQAPRGKMLNGLPSITAQGDQVLLGQHAPDLHEAVAIDVATGEARTRVAHTWWADHFHFCPYDEQWIGYGRQTWGMPDYHLIGNQIWAWHQDLAPQGRRIFDQVTGAADPERPLFTTHDRWTFHDTGLLTIVYGASPGGPRGLYQVFPDGRAPRLVSQSDRDWHCNVSIDGSVAVVDTKGPFDAVGGDLGLDDPDGISDIMLVDMHTGQRAHLARTHSRTHPYHPHPAFSPAGTHVIYNDFAPDGPGSAPVVKLIEID